MVELTEAGCVAFSQAEVPIVNTQVLQRALQYAATFGYSVWLRPQDFWLGGRGGQRAAETRLGLSGIPVAAEVIALHTVFELLRGSARHRAARSGCTCAASAARPAWIWCARPRPRACQSSPADVSVHNLHLY